MHAVGSIAGGAGPVNRGSPIARARPVAAVVGDVLPEVSNRIRHRSLVADNGTERALREPLWCIENSASALLRELPSA